MHSPGPSILRTPCLLALLAIVSCAPPAQPPATRPSDGTSARRPVPAADRPYDVEAQLRGIRERVGAAPAADAASLRLQAAQLLEGLGRTDEARFEYLGATGAGPSDAAEAWDALARLARSDGDGTGVVHAQLEALRVSPEDGREARASALAASLAQLPPGPLRALARSAAGSPAEPVVSRVLKARGAASGPLVAFLLPLSGRFENFGRAFRRGAEIAIADRAAADGATAPVRSVFRDTSGDLAAATRAAREAVVEDGAVAIVGPLLSVPALGAGAIADVLGVPLVAPTATDPAVRTIGRHVLPLDPPPAELIEPLVTMTMQDLGAQRFGALVPRDPQAEERERVFRQAVESRGGVFALSVAYDPGERDFRKQLELLEDARLDAVYVPAETPDLEALVPQLEFYEFTPRLLGHGGWTSSRVFHPGVGSLEGTLLSVQEFDDPGCDFAQHLKSAVEQTDGAEPTRFHVQGYRTAAAVLFALDHGVTTPEALGEMLRMRPLWPERPRGEEVHLLVIRGGALVPATAETLAPPAAVPADSAAAGSSG